MPDINKYVSFLRKEKEINVEKVLLFGSFAKGTATEESDIDLAIISPEFGKAPLMEKMKLYEWRYDANVQANIQPVPLGVEEFNHSGHFFVEEIKKTGIDITDKI